MEESSETSDLKEIISTDIDCENTNFSMISDNMKSLEYNFETSNSEDSLYKLNTTKENNETKESNNDENLFDTEDMDVFDSTAFMKNDSPLSENLELDKLMEQLNDTIEGNIFSSDNLTENIDEEGNISNESSEKENDVNLENIEELNLLNNDIISYINSDDTAKNSCEIFLQDKGDSKNDKETESDLSVDDKTNDKPNKTQDIIDLINKELDDTLQFTNVLCHYIYSDVIVGKDFFKLFCSEKVNVNKTAVEVVDKTVE